MGTKTRGRFTVFNLLRSTKSSVLSADHKGQALVEFTLVFLLLLVVAWIPADFGLAFYSGQIAENAAREGARTAAADPNLPAQTGTCTIPACYSLTANTILRRTAEHLPAALLGPSRVDVVYPTVDSSGCNQMVSVKVTGQYPYFFYHLLQFMGVNVTVPQIVREQKMRWEHQAACPLF
jgi:Flp pilus assembly protein TadG